MQRDSGERPGPLTLSDHYAESLANKPEEHKHKAGKSDPQPSHGNMLRPLLKRLGGLRRAARDLIQLRSNLGVGLDPHVLLRAEVARDLLCS